MTRASHDRFCPPDQTHVHFTCGTGVSGGVALSTCTHHKRIHYTRTQTPRILTEREGFVRERDVFRRCHGIVRMAHNTRLSNLSLRDEVTHEKSLPESSLNLPTNTCPHTLTNKQTNTHSHIHTLNNTHTHFYTQRIHNRPH